VAKMVRWQNGHPAHKNSSRSGSSSSSSRRRRRRKKKTEMSVV